MTLRNGSGLHLLEEIVDEIVGCLKSNLPGKLSTLSGQYPDKLKLPAPASNAYYTPTNEAPSSLNITYPSIFVIGARAQNAVGDEGMGGGGGDMEISYRMAIFVLCKGESEAQLQKYIYRYTLAVVETLVQSDSISIGEVFLELIDYDNPVISSSDDYVRDVPMQFLVVTNESY